jgi:hypothetical protein
MELSTIVVMWSLTATFSLWLPANVTLILRLPKSRPATS